MLARRIFGILLPCHCSRGPDKFWSACLSLKFFICGVWVLLLRNKVAGKGQIGFWVSNVQEGNVSPLTISKETQNPFIEARSECLFSWINLSYGCWIIKQNFSRVFTLILVHIWGLMQNWNAMVHGMGKTWFCRPYSCHLCLILFYGLPNLAIYKLRLWYLNSCILT